MFPIRVLHVFGGLNTGGAESRTMDIYRHINKNEVQFDFLIHTNKKGFYENEILSMGGRIYRVPRFSIKTIFTYPIAIKKFFQSHPEFNIVHGHMLSTAFIYLNKAKKNSIPIRIAHSRNSKRAQKDIKSKIKNITEKLSHFNATHLFAVSKLAGYGTFGKNRVDSGEVKIIPNAINTQEYTFNKNIRSKLREELRLNDNLVIGHIGRFSPQKNHLYLLDIFLKIKKEQTKSKLILIGDGPMRQQLKDRISSLGLNEDVILLGVRNDVNELLQAMDVLLFPSTHEGFPGVILEAQAAGLPSIISNSITDEIKITDLVESVPLEEEIDTWSRKVINAGLMTERRNTKNEIVAVGYDIDAVAKWYENFYLSSIAKL